MAWKDRWKVEKLHTLTLERTALEFGFTHFFICVFVVVGFFFICNVIC